MSSTASADELRAAYRRLARRLHPDMHGGAPSAAMTALNEAWYVLRDPGRRAVYDASLRPAPSAPPRGDRSPIEADEPFEQFESEQRARLGFPIGWMLVLGLLVVIFVFTAYAASSKREGEPGRVDGLLRPGECVDIDAQGYAFEVPCTGPHAGVVQLLPPFDAPCPSGSSSYRDRNAMSQVCVL